MNAAHLHLLLNHVPTIGTVAAVGLLLVAFVRASHALKHAALEAIVIVAVVTLPVFTTGSAAHRELRERPDISDTAVRMHLDAAIGGFAAAEFAGFFAWIALWQMRRRGQASQGVVAGAAVLSIVALALMGRAATLGGEIRHPEIVAEGTTLPAIAADAFVASRISEYLTGTSRWAWPAAETLHFLGLSLSFGVLLAVNLRIAGAMPRVPFADIHRLLPWGMLGLGVNLITGMLFFVASPGQYVGSAPFDWKIILLMITAANFLYLTEFRTSWAVEGFRASVIDKSMAAVSIAAWLGVLFAGRMLPFLGRAF